jgi:predicted ATPase/DNA-binding SARP family transcriptional activator
MTDRRVLLLGVPRVEQNKVGIQIERRRALALLAYLAVSGQTHSREALAAFFWADYDQSRAFAYLRNNLWTLNKALGDDWALIDNETVKFNDTTIDVDVNRFHQLLTQDHKPTTHAAYQAQVASLTQAAALYRGDFLAGFTLRDCPEFEEWQFLQTESLKRELTGALERLVDSLIMLGDFETAKTHTRRWITSDPLHESAHRQLMRLYMWSGQQAAALRQYRDVETLLDKELGVPPDAETTGLYEQIQARRLPAPPSLPSDSAAVPHETTASDAPLPIPATPFIGRDVELAEVQRLLGDSTCRLLSVIGAGGIGKTSLALHVARAAQPHYRDGVHFVSLAPVCENEFLVPTIAAALKSASLTSHDAKTVLLRELRHKNLLLVLDNFEHLIADAELLSEMLAAAPGVKLLVTSRERLNLREEWLYELQGLSYPSTLDGQALETYNAVNLFVQSARRVRPDFALNAENAPAIAQICRLVQGMPLALELAATWLQLLTCAEIAQEIQNGLDILTTEVRNIPERHRSLRAVFEQTWQRLNAQEQTCLSRLSVLRGGFRQEAAQAIAGASLALLRALTSKSLLWRMENGRYAVHELLRQFAQQKLSDSDLAEALERHCAYFVAFLQQREQALKDRRQTETLHEIEQEIDNIRSAWLHAVAHRNLDLIATSLESLFLYFVSLSKFQEGLELIAKAIAVIDEGRVEHRLLLGQLLTAKAWGCSQGASAKDLLAIADHAAELLRQFPHHPETALWLLVLGNLQGVPGAPEDKPAALIRESLSIYQAQQNNWGISCALSTLAGLIHIHTRHDEALRYAEQSLQLAKEIGQPSSIMLAQSVIGRIAYTIGDFARTKETLDSNLALAQRIGNHRAIMQIKTTELYYAHNNPELVATLLKSIQFYREAGDARQIAWALYEMGTVALFDQQMEEAARYYDECLPIFKEIADEQGICWTRIWQATIALARQEIDQAEQYLLESLSAIEGITFPWGVAGAYYVLGDVELARGNTDKARQYFVDAVRIAHEAQSMVQILRHLSGAATWLMAVKAVERAAALIFFIHEHPSVWIDTKQRTTKMLDELSQMLSIEQLEQLRNKSKRFTIETVILDLLQGL